MCRRPEDAAACFVATKDEQYENDDQTKNRSRNSTEEPQSNPGSHEIAGYIPEPNQVNFGSN
jgi:hypothetical protein